LAHRFMTYEAPIKALEEDKPKDEKIVEAVKSQPDVAPVKTRKTRAKKVVVKTRKPRSNTK